MISLRMMGGMLVAAGLCLSAPAGAAPAIDPPSAEPLPLVNVGGCHSDVRRHYVPEFGRTEWHRHRQPGCRPVRADPPSQAAPRDCHRDVRRHYLPQYGRSVAHRHVGESCRARVYREYSGRPRPDRSCVQLGPIYFCED
ncbi:MAG: hypothetical protein ABTQ31_01130 [Rhizobiaceae bacterium]